MTDFYLASKSPRRRDILASLGYSFSVLAPENTTPGAYAGDEVQMPGESAEDYVSRTARQKAADAFGLLAARGLPAAPVLASDTAVICRGRILGKPFCRNEELAFLQQLQGTWHEVRTAVVLATGPQDYAEAVSVSRVFFRPMSTEEMIAYAWTEEPYDKAGGYGIQGLAGIYIEKIEGSYTGIMGLPVFETAALLRGAGILPGALAPAR